MTRAYTVTLYCNQGDCAASFTSEPFRRAPFGDDLERRVRSAAAAAGWSRPPVDLGCIDLCPEHAGDIGIHLSGDLRDSRG